MPFQVPTCKHWVAEWPSPKTGDIADSMIMSDYHQQVDGCPDCDEYNAPGYSLHLTKAQAVDTERLMASINEGRLTSTDSKVSPDSKNEGKGE